MYRGYTGNVYDFRSSHSPELSFGDFVRLGNLIEFFRSISLFLKDHAKLEDYHMVRYYHSYEDVTHLYPSLLSSITSRFGSF